MRRLRLRSPCGALADEASAIRADLRQKSDVWEDAVDEARAATAEVGYKDTLLDQSVKLELKAAVALMTSTMTAKQRDAVTAKLFGGKAPSERNEGRRRTGARPLCRCHPRPPGDTRPTFLEQHPPASSSASG